jgi:hypothetical protein
LSVTNGAVVEIPTGVALFPELLVEDAFRALYLSGSVVLCGVVAVLTVSSVVLLIVEDSGSCETLAVGFM